MEQNDFSWALRKMKAGRFVFRRGWNGAGQYAFIKEPQKTDHGAPTVPYLLLHNVHTDLVPWIPSSGDLFAEDWEIAGKDVDMRVS